MSRSRLHAALPRRPDRTSQREERDDRIRVHYEALGQCPMQISTSTDRLHVRLVDRRDGRFVSRFMFSLEDIDALERALDAASEPQLRCIRTLSLRTGENLDIGAGQGGVCLRIRRPEGIVRIHTRLEGPALVALRYAVADLRSRPTSITAA
jgi:hypothetical protein